MSTEELRNSLINIKPFDAKSSYLFISYCHKDKHLVWQDVIRLKNRNINCWIDCESIDGWTFDEKQDWTDQALPALIRASAAMIYVSPESFYTRGFAKECIAIQENNIRFCCIFVGFKDNLTPNKIISLIEAVPQFEEESTTDYYKRKLAYFHITGVENKEKYFIKFSLEANEDHLNVSDIDNALRSTFINYKRSDYLCKLDIDNILSMPEINEKTLFEEIKNYQKNTDFDDASYKDALNAKYFIYIILKNLGISFDNPTFQKLLKFIHNAGEHNPTDNRIEQINGLIAHSIRSENISLFKLVQYDDEAGSRWRNTRYAYSRIQETLMNKNYINYLCGQIISISYDISSQTVNQKLHDNFYELFRFVENVLFAEDSLDENGGWCLYRFPWITARILIGLHSVYNELSGAQKEVITKALQSLGDRHAYEDRKKPIWTSGASLWVPDYESTALCLEALLLYYDRLDSKLQERFKETIKFLLSNSEKLKWLYAIDISLHKNSKEGINYDVGNIMLASVVYRIIKKLKFSEYEELLDTIRKVLYYKSLLPILTERIDALQASTIPAIIAYILLIVKT